MSIRVCVAGATGRVGSTIVRQIVRTDDLQLSGAVARTASGTAIPLPDGGAMPIVARVEDALGAADVLVDFTTPHAAVEHAMIAVHQGVDVVLGTTSLSEDELARLDVAARSQNRIVLYAENFAITAVLLQECAMTVARLMPCNGIIDYASPGTHSPLATSARIASTLAPFQSEPVPPVQSVRVPGYGSMIRVVFGRASGESLVLEHTARSLEAYADGVLFAVREFRRLSPGLTHGLLSLIRRMQECSPNGNSL